MCARIRDGFALGNGAALCLLLPVGDAPSRAAGSQHQLRTMLG